MISSSSAIDLRDLIHTHHVSSIGGSSCCICGSLSRRSIGVGAVIEVVNHLGVEFLCSFRLRAIGVATTTRSTTARAATTTTGCVGSSLGNSGRLRLSLWLGDTVRQRLDRSRGRGMSCVNNDFNLGVCKRKFDEACARNDLPS
jgi:hypothetical protein